jgi:hypothetical protein
VLGTVISRSGVVMRRSVLVLAMLAVGACSDDGSPSETPGSLAITSGNNQTVVTGATAGAPLVVTLTNQSGGPMPGITIGWSVSPTIGGTISNVATETDANGQAKATFTAVTPAGISGVTAGQPVAAGTVTINALASGLPPVPLTITVTK